MQSKIVKPGLISILLHIAAVFALLSINMPVHEQDNASIPFESYLVIRSDTKKSEPEQLTSDLNKPTPDGSKSTQEQALTNQNNLANTKQNSGSEADSPPAKLNIVTPSSQPSNTAELLIDAASKESGGKTMENTRRFINKINNNELSIIAQDSYKAFTLPKPIKSNANSTSQGTRLHPFMDSFGPKGNGINVKVISTVIGANETNILLDGACYTLTETALDDRVWRGQTLWKGSNVCGSRDKFNGQLQKSLDKYLKKLD